MKLFGRSRNKPAESLPVLRTERLVLRAFDPSDAVDVFAYAQSDKVGPMAGWAPHKTLEESRRMVAGFIAAGDVWAVVEKKTGHVIGTVSLHKDLKRRIEGCRQIGYALGEKYWGQGFATEACRAALDYAFDELGCPVMSATHFPINHKSRRVIKKLGFTPEGTMRHAMMLPDGTPGDLVVYSLLREEYEALKAGKQDR